MNKSGFTLIEILATITIMLLITVVAVPSTISLLDKGKEQSYNLQVKEFESAAESLVIDNKSHWNIHTITSNRCVTLDDLAGYNYIKEVPDNPLTDEKFTGYVEIKNNNSKIEYEYKNDNGCIPEKYIASLNPSYVLGADEEIDISGDDTTNIYSPNLDTSGANAPVLENELIPVVYDYDKNVWIKADTTKNWYNYSEQMWANAVNVREIGSKTKQYYLNEAPPGTIINENDILNMWVWIPRYAYTIPRNMSDIYYYAKGYTSSRNTENSTMHIKFKTADSPGNLKFYSDFSTNGGQGNYLRAQLNTDYKSISYDGNLTFSLSAQTEYDLSITYNVDDDASTPASYKATIKNFEFDIPLAEQPTFSNTAYNDTEMLWKERFKLDDGKESEEIKIKFIDTNVINNGLGYYIDERFEENSYLTHPAFTFDNKNLSGIWVGKFLTSKENDNYIIKMNQISNSIIEFDGNGNTTNGFNGLEETKFGLSALFDTHLIKNTEWGSVAYLTQSKYGQLQNLFNTPSISGTTSITGCSSGGINLTSFYSCPYQYNIKYYGEGASTTGNVYGIYDMNYEQLVSGGTDFKKTKATNDCKEYNYDDKYFNKYATYKFYNYDSQKQNSGYTQRDNLYIKGDATFETEGWYNGQTGEITHKEDYGNVTYPTTCNFYYIRKKIFSFDTTTLTNIKDNNYSGHVTLITE